MKNLQKYHQQFFMPPQVNLDWLRKDHVDHAPIWCSVDLRDGNQALIEPMGLQEKLEFFDLLVKLGFKEIEIGFPAASETEFAFARQLIEQNKIPEDVTIQVLTQAREHIIRRTFEAIQGAGHAIVHLYNSTSVAQREQVFHKNKKEIKELAVEGARLLQELAKETEGDFSFEYSPESFSGTEVDYALEVCNAVLNVWKPEKDKKVIINIPTTVEVSMPHVFGAQIAYLSEHMDFRKQVTLSVHPHNDRGCGVATTEMAILAGCDRVEGTLFGNGERTGNVDVVTLALNMYSQGVDPKLDFSDLMSVAQTYERLTGMKVYERSPYAGALVFTAFSGSHQDAISKGFSFHESGKDNGIWSVPYLPIDPRDIGRQYDGDVIRINSQSGKGGVSYILKTGFGISVPKKMQEDLGYTMKHISDREHAELAPDRVYQIFDDLYIHPDMNFQITDCHFKQTTGGILVQMSLQHGGSDHVVEANGNGRIDAVSNALKQYFGVRYQLSAYEEHALTSGSSSKACAFVCITAGDKEYWGVGIHEDIIKASVDALAVSVNHLEGVKEAQAPTDERIGEILNYMQKQYLEITLEDLAKKFYLSKPYLSKYIKEKSGQTFGEHLKKIRLKKAGSLLKNGNMRVERVAEMVGYHNVEHFNRLFKKKYGMTPVQYRSGSVS